eukprot:jgi/Psemu1/293132/fgenesh1_pg.1686_\
MVITRNSIWHLSLATTAFLFRGNAVSALKAPCNSTAECESKFHPGSICQFTQAEKDENNKTTGLCTNPFVGGCLRTILGAEASKVIPWSDEKFRACNSEDPKYITDGDTTYCTPSEFDYMEVRISAGGWESTIITMWIMQIFLSELLRVPVSVQTTVEEPGDSISFYDPQSGYKTHEDFRGFAGFEKADEVVDCTRTKNETCFHVIPELWVEQGTPLFENITNIPVVFEASSLVPQHGWFVPKFVPDFVGEFGSGSDLLSYLAWGKEENRHLIAEVFKQPISWADYCYNISSTNCSIPDGVATRPPRDKLSEDKDVKDENKMFFFSDDNEVLFTGYFHTTEENNCTLNPTTCKGHIIDYPCSFYGFTDQHLYHNNMLLERSHYYNSSDIREIVAASNWTQSPIVLVWWMPDTLISQYELLEISRIILPPPTYECENNRALQNFDLTTGRCYMTPSEKIGSELGKCGYYATSLQTIYAEALKEHTYNQTDPLRSPAFEALGNLQVTLRDIEGILDSWIEDRDADYFGNDLRNSVCQWVAMKVTEDSEAKNWKRFMPRGYPRKLMDTGVAGATQGSSFYACLVLAIPVMVLICVISFVIITKHKTSNAIKHAQPHFLSQYLVGNFLLSICAILLCAVPSSKICMAIEWLSLLGITLALLPVLIKVAAINHIIDQAKKLKRVKTTKEHLFLVIGIVTLVQIVYLTIWTFLNPFEIQKSSTLKDVESDEGHYEIVKTHLVCSTESNVWKYVVYAWELGLTFAAAILAFQSRYVRDDFNESRELGNMAFVHFLFCVLRLILSVTAVAYETVKGIKGPIEGYLMIIDSLLSILIYFGPKLWTLSEKNQTPRANIHVYGMSGDFRKSSTYSTSGNRTSRNSTYKSAMHSTDELE